MSERLNGILERLGQLPEVSAFGDIIDAIRAAYDVDHVYYYALSLGLDAQRRDEYYVGELSEERGIIRRGGRRLAAMSYTPDWIARYMEAKFFDFDPVLAGSQGSFDPIDWRDLDWRGADYKRFLAEAVEFGVGNQGYTVPVRGPSGQFAIFTVNKNCPDDVWTRIIIECRTDFMLLAHFTHQRMLKLSGLADKHPTRPLSRRERDAIRLIADGLSRGQAAEKLGISENTFRVYIDSARHKLGALNVPHAVALASHRGLITPG
ncbi:MAG: LuxR family transcriptional regulator [Pseudomonadota bacterium]